MYTTLETILQLKSIKSKNLHNKFKKNMCQRIKIAPKNQQLTFAFCHK